MKNYIKVLMTVLVLFISTQIFAQQLIPFQARLTDGSGLMVPNGVYSVNFNIYDAATAGTALWTETHSTVSVVGGVVNVILGSITPLNDPDKNGDLSDAVTFYNTNGTRFIGVTIGAGQEMVPRHQLIPSFHATTTDNAANAAKLGNQPPSFYSTVAKHDADIQQLSLGSDSAILQVVTDHGSDIQTINNRIDQLDTLLVPTGTVMAFAGNATSVPAGWLLCNGASVTRTAYANLFAVIGAAHGTGDSGTTTFNLPDYRGRFLRGQDLGVGRDSDVSTRTGSGSGSNIGDAVGSVQDHQVQNHYHAMGPNNVSATNGGGVGSSYNATLVDWPLSFSSPLIGNAYNGNIGAETRPINIYVNYIIKI